MSKNTLPANFESFADARKQGFVNMMNLKESGKNVVGVFCTYSPNEIIMAAGAIEVGLCSTSDETIPDAEQVLQKNLCPLIKSSYGFAITDKCPYMYFSDLVVGETTCDGKKKMYELLGEIKDVHIMQLPQTQTDQVSIDMWRSEVRRFKERVEAKFDVEITDEKLREAIKTRNRERTALKELYEINTLCPPPMWGLNQLQVLFGSQFKFNKEEKIAEINAVKERLLEEYNNGARPVPESAKRIIVTGCPMGGVTEKLIKAIEESGGVVVAYENCTGAKQMDRLVDETGDPLTAIADRYLTIGCSVMTPDENRYELLERLCKQYKADGVVEMTLQACHTFAVETTQIKRIVTKLGLPYIHVETDYSTSDVGQLKTRMEAFIEMID